MSQIPFSVIMPFYAGDQAIHLEDAIRSLYQQSVRANEVVLIQDGPVPDELDEVIKKWQENMPEIKVVKLPVNKGLSSALNHGIRAASYEWLARMDADDFCVPERFEKQFALIKKDPELSIVGSWITEYDEDLKEPLADRRLPSSHERILQYARWRCPFNHMTVIYRKSALEKLGCYKDYGAVGDDYELWARFLVNGYKSANIAESLVKARTGKEFYTRRRRGWKYFKNEVREINELYRLRLINPLHYLFHLSVKAVTRFSPPVLVKFIYKGIRKSGKGE